MEVERASVMGFCYGVRRALDMLEKASRQYGAIQTLGELVHNKQVVERLAARGIRPAQRIQELSGPAVAVATHGVGPQTWHELQASHLPVVDATCPWVSRAQKVAHRLASSGFAVLILGDTHHPEVTGILEWAGGKGRVVEDSEIAGLYSPWPKRLGILSQTTQSTQKFTEFVQKMVGIALHRGTEIRIINTICHATQQHQEAAIKLARRVDVMVVVGGRGSANTRRLAETCSGLGVATFQVETAQDLQADWFQGANKVGVTAGASTPDEVVQEVIKRLESLEGEWKCSMRSSASTST